MIGGAAIAGAPIAGTTTLGAVTVTAAIKRPLVLLVDMTGRCSIVDNKGLAMTDLWIKRGDTSPVLTGQLLDGDGRPVPLTGATVALKARNRAGVTVIDAAMTVDDAATAQVRYAWVPANTATQAELEGEVEVTFADSTVQTWPTPGFLAIHVVANVPGV